MENVIIIIEGMTLKSIVVGKTQEHRHFEGF